MKGTVVYSNVRKSSMISFMPASILWSVAMVMTSRDDCNGHNSIFT